MIALSIQSRAQMNVAFTPNRRRVASGGEAWLLHLPVFMESAWLWLSVEIRTGQAWNDETKNPKPLSADARSKRQGKLREGFGGKF